MVGRIEIWFNNQHNPVDEWGWTHYWHSANDIGVEGEYQLIEVIKRSWEKSTIKRILQRSHTISGVIRQGDGRGPSAGGYLSWSPRFLFNVPTQGGGEGRASNCFCLIPNRGEEEPALTAGMWDDKDCLLSLHYICERPKPPTVTV